MITRQQVTQQLKNMFVSMGIPYELVTDNATQFTASTFIEFKKMYNFTHRPMGSQEECCDCKTGSQTAKSSVSSQLCCHRTESSSTHDWRADQNNGPSAAIETVTKFN